MKYSVALTLVSCAIILTGCGDDPLNEIKNFVATVRARPPEAIKPLPDIKQVENFVYQPDIKGVPRRDPFERTDKVEDSDKSTKTTSGVAPPDPLRRKEQLEQYELDALKMVGTINQKDVMWGLLLTPDGLFRVKANNYVGKNNGQISRITEDKIELTEIIADQAEGWKERQASIGIKTKD